MNQQYTSADTSISVVNKVYTQYKYRAGSVILDYGGGKYDKNVEYMKQKSNSEVLVYDPYNRTNEHNQAVMQRVKMSGVDYIVCSNVLNVIAEIDVIRQIMQTMCGIASNNTEVLITIYEGDRTGEGKKTSRGWQRNQKTKDYVALAQQYFKEVTMKKGIIICKK